MRCVNVPNFYINVDNFRQKVYCDTFILLAIKAPQVLPFNFYIVPNKQKWKKNIYGLRNETKDWNPKRWRTYIGECKTMTVEKKSLDSGKQTLDTKKWHWTMENCHLTIEKLYCIFENLHCAVINWHWRLEKLHYTEANRNWTVENPNFPLEK